MRSVEGCLEQARIEKAKAATLALNERRTRRLTVALISSVSTAKLIGGFFRFNIQREKQQSVTRLNVQLDNAISDARLHWNRASSDPTDSVAVADGNAALNLAKTYSTRDAASAELVSEFNGLTERYAELKRDRDLFAELERLRQGPVTVDVSANQFDWVKIETGYQRLFMENGFSSDQQICSISVRLSCF